MSEGRRPRGIVSTATGLLDLLLPTGCIACGDWLPDRSGDRLLCGRCRSRLRRASWPRCPRCHYPRGTGRPSEDRCRECRDWPDAVATARHAHLLQPPADTLVHALKYEGWEELAPLMARAMALQDLPWREPGDPPVLVPVPTTAARRRRRGYNQAERLAAALADALDLPLVTDLERGDTGPTQVALSASQRWANVRSAFRVGAGLGRELRGARVILVDDVLTTGSTACAAALALARAGTARVDVVTFARAVSFRSVGR